MHDLNLVARFLPALFACAACDAQVGDEYLGEVMLELRGSVVTEGAEQGDYEPLVFFLSEGTKPPVVRGQVTGVFPSGFVFSITEPPPAEAFELPGDLAIAAGFFALAPKGADFEALPTPGLSQGDCDMYHGDTCKETQSLCNAQGECFERDLTCTYPGCTTLELSGDPSALDLFTIETGDIPMTFGPKEFEWKSCADDTCLVNFTTCGKEGCYNEVLQCPVADSEFERSCVVNAERGPRSLNQMRPLPIMDYVVLYFTEEGIRRYQESPWSDEYLPFRVGYNLFTYGAPTMDQWLEWAHCVQQVPIKAMDQYNTKHGTNHGPGETLLVDTGDELRNLEDALLDECPDARHSVVVEPGARSLKLRLGDPTRLF